MCEGARVFTINHNEVSDLIEEKIRSIDTTLSAVEELAAKAPSEAAERVTRWVKNGREEAERWRKELQWQLAHVALGTHVVTAAELQKLRCDYEPLTPPERIPGYVLVPDEMMNAKQVACEPMAYRGRSLF